MPTVIPAPGTATPAVPIPGIDASLQPLPLSVAQHVPSSARVNDIVDTILYYGILLLGAGFPLVGAAYALLFR